MDEKKIKELEKIANNVRLDVLDMVYNAKSGHIGGAFSIAEALTYIYFVDSNINIDNIENIKRDKVILSKGHCVAALYSVLKQKGLICDELSSFRNLGSNLQGHPDMKKLSAIDYSTRSLGQGLSISVGMAIAKKLIGDQSKVYCILGDGELEERQIYEAILTCMKYNLDNLYILIDNNKYQLDGSIEEIGGIKKIAQILKGFGLEVICVNGHDFNEIDIGFDVAKKINGPKCIIFETIKANGVSFMQGSNIWHGKCPNKEEYENARKELEKNGK